MELEKILSAFDRAQANVDRLQSVWDRAREFIPTGPAAGSNPEYDNHARAWSDLIGALPAVDGYRISAELPDIDHIGRSFLGYAEISEHPFSVWEEIERPERELAEYAYRLGRARRRAVRERLEVLTGRVGVLLGDIKDHVDRAALDRSARLETRETQEVAKAVDEIERLIGDSSERTGRWGDLHRHLRFSEPHDWDDIRSLDWPSVLEDIEAAGFADTDPLAIDIDDLGAAASGDISGKATSALNWDAVSDAAFERVLFDLLQAFPAHHNVKWLTKTNAPDRGRDLSFDRSIETPTGEVRTESVMVQAKHWRSKSVPPDELAKVVAQAETWPSAFHVVIVATSGRFTTDAVTWAEKRAKSGSRPDVELWCDADLERLLARHPSIAAAHGLR